tara:strand:+ start:3965 stop:4525 length:561 start_codon:yes stop_codon:yes gene_type:complete
MDYEIQNNGIAIFKKAFTKEECQFYIDFFERSYSRGQHFKHGHNEVDDTRTQILSATNTRGDGNFLDKLWNILYPLYINKFNTLKEVPVSVMSVKVQKTKVGGGYHKWHHETSFPNYMNRMWVGMLYLNTVEEGGETEFLSHSVRVKAVEGDFVIFPATYTHNHRGNPPISNDKYIATSWGEYQYK